MLARQLKLSPQDVDDIGVAALLHDVGNIEITAKVIQKAMGNVKRELQQTGERTFQGTDLVRSLGSVLRGALPLLVDQHSGIHEELETTRTSRDAHVGASIICAVRAYDSLSQPSWGEVGLSPRDAIGQLRREADQHPPFVIDALERVIATSADSPEEASELATSSA
jgi:HD-GYP domain-containing protein (c-di-GMP phosphodiesterase class II)